MAHERFSEAASNFLFENHLFEVKLTPCASFSDGKRHMK